MSEPQVMEPIEVGALVERAKRFRKDGYRLVQISATRLPEQVQLTYSFDRESHLANVRLYLPAAEAKLPSISGEFWCAFLYENELHDLFNINVEGIAVDFHGQFYNTAVKFPFGTAKASASPGAPVPKPNPAAAATTKPVSATAT